MPFRAPALILLCLLLGHAETWASAVLDQKRIHSEYNEGNFDGVISVLEKFMERNKTYSLDDSVFIAKHLAVVYSANPETREKGKYYMYRLLALLPSAKLIDMYVSDEIERIFDKVREEYLARQQSFGLDSSQASAPARPARAPRSSKPFYLAAGGTALVAVGVTSYFMFADSPRKTEKTYDVE